MGFVVALVGVAQGVEGQKAPSWVCNNIKALYQRSSDTTLLRLVGACEASYEVDLIPHVATDSQMVDDALRLMDTHMQIPEYHDEQRLTFQRSGQTVFGPKVGIYASPALGGFKDREKFRQHGDTGVLVAWVYVEATIGTTLPDTYAELGLKPGMNCLRLVALAGMGWAGHMSQPDNAGKCDPAQGYFTLGRVHADRVQKLAAAGPLNNALGSPQYFAEEDYPAVARFGESRERRPLLGVKCADAWCEMSSVSFTSIPGLASDNGLSGREALIKGWYDEQILSIQQGNQLVPSDVRAAIVPSPNLADLGIADFENGWRRVATIIVHGNVGSTKYGAWGLQQGRTYLDLRLNGDVWESRLTYSGPGPSKTWYTLDRMPHLDVAVPGTARFRWTKGDEGIWTPCGQACCRVTGY
jgi:hypothetical protein